jgi:hypothetical protein
MGFFKPSVATIHLLVATSLVLAACATLPHPEYPSTHPANPAAPTAVVMPTSTALSAYKSFSGTGAREGDATSDAGRRPSAQAEQSGEEGTHEHEH